MSRTSNRRSRIYRRLIDSNHHTVGYIIEGQRRISVDEAVTMARKDMLSNVRVVNGSTRAYIQGVNSSLSDLPATRA